METKVYTASEIALRMQALELAQRITPPVYNQNSNGYTQPTIPQLTVKADEILAYITGQAQEDKSSLINKLRTVLCEGK